jgi:hypothetical protein
MPGSKKKQVGASAIANGNTQGVSTDVLIRVLAANRLSHRTLAEENRSIIQGVWWKKMLVSLVRRAGGSETC